MSASGRAVARMPYSHAMGRYTWRAWHHMRPGFMGADFGSSHSSGETGWMPSHS